MSVIRSANIAGEYLLKARMAAHKHAQCPDRTRSYSPGQNSKAGRWLLFLLFLLFVLMSSGEGYSQTASAITPTTGAGDLNTGVAQTGTSYTITGGTRPGGGGNLFHSFQDFSVPANNVANFLNESGIPTTNILSRVTGNNPSSIFGTIQTTGFGNANFVLVNPAGIVFGPTASLNVGGSVSVTTADYLRLADDGRFNAIPNTTTDALLSSAPVAAYGFLGANPGSIIVQGSELRVPEKHAVSLIGGSIEITSSSEDHATKPALISAPGGQVNLVSMASSGEVAGLNFEPSPAASLGSITLSQGSTVSVSGDAAGMVRIRSGRLVITDATISADTGEGHGASAAVDLAVTDKVVLSDSRGLPIITARTSGAGNAGAVLIRAADLSASSTSSDLFAMIDSHTSGIGNGGSVNISTTRNVNVTGALDGFTLLVDSGTIGPAGGHGGNVSITAKDITVTDAVISTGDTVALYTGQDAVGSGGHVSIAADSLRLSHAEIYTDTFFGGQAGNLTISAKTIQTEGFSILSLKGFGGGGTLRITTDSLAADSTQFETETVSGPGGGIFIQANSVELRNGSSMRSQTVGDADAGTIQINASDHMTLSDRFTFLGDPETLSAYTRPTGIFTNSLGLAGTQGDAGAIDIRTPRLEILGGARIDSSTQSHGHGGDITIHSDIVSISKERPLGVAEQDIFGLGSSRPSGLFTRTVGNEFCSGVCGSAGHILITTDSLLMGAGSQINSGTNNSGLGGDITISAGNKVSLSGTLSDGSPVGIFSRTIGTTQDAGSGGNIFLTAGQSVTVKDGASISASSTGPGNAGNISINAGRRFDIGNGSVTTSASQATGGNIDIKATDLVRVVNGQISTSVLGGTGNGGNIFIDPNVVMLQNSQIVAKAVAGSGGNITITTPLFLVDQSSLVDASSQFGLNGTVTIQSPTSNLSGTVGQLTSKPAPLQLFAHHRCAALVGGQQSTFIVTGGTARSSTLDGWLYSPSLMALATGETLGVKGEARTRGLSSASENETVSLRRLTPAGFLVRSFALDGPTSCRS